MEAPQIQYVLTSDGVNIAYTVIGDGVPMIFSPNIWCHLEIQFTGEFREAWQRMAGEGIMVVPYDMRGMGMSDRDVQDFSLESQMADIEAVRHRLGFDQFALYGNIFSSIATIAYAANHPERVSHLILNLPFANGAEFYQSFPTLQGLETMRAMAEGHWDLYTRMHATAISPPGVDPADLAALMRECTTPDTLRRYFTELQTQDVRPLLTQVLSPTLILSDSEGELSYLMRRFAREVAAAIPNARLRTHQRFKAPGLPAARLATEFVLGRPVEWGAPPSPARPGRAEAPSGTAVILFADIVDSTALTERLGDTAFRDKASGLDEAMREAIRANGGTPVDGKTLGDGVLAVFSSAKQAIACAQACHEAASTAGLSLHAGIHAGDVIREDDNVYGGAVNIAARVAAASPAGETLVSGTVRDLARTSAGVSFEDRGEHSLKGIDEPVRVWAVVSGQH